MGEDGDVAKEEQNGAEGGGSINIKHARPREETTKGQVATWSCLRFTIAECGDSKLAS